MNVRGKRDREMNRDGDTYRERYKDGNGVRTRTVRKRKKYKHVELVEGERYEFCMILHAVISDEWQLCY